MTGIANSCGYAMPNNWDEVLLTTQAETADVDNAESADEEGVLVPMEGTVQSSHTDTTGKWFTRPMLYLIATLFLMWLAIEYARNGQQRRLWSCICHARAHEWHGRDGHLDSKELG